jgi:predicted molibdopterin-dependent oxidoreductase YjgC
MGEEALIRINGKLIRVRAGISVASAVLLSGEWSFHRSVTGEPRTALCGMGICYECRLTIDGRPNCRSCQIVVTDGMKVETR